MKPFPLGDMPLETFLSEYWQKKPLLIRDGLPDTTMPAWKNVLDEEQITAFEFKADSIRLAKEHHLEDHNRIIWRDTQAFSGGWNPVRLF